MAPLGELHLLYINPVRSLEVWMLSILHEGSSLFNVLNYSLSSRMHLWRWWKESHIYTVGLGIFTCKCFRFTLSGLTSEKHITADSCSLLATTKRKPWVPVSHWIVILFVCRFPVCLLLSSSLELVYNFSFSAPRTNFFV